MGMIDVSNVKIGETIEIEGKIYVCMPEGKQAVCEGCAFKEVECPIVGCSYFHDHGCGKGVIFVEADKAQTEVVPDGANESELAPASEPTTATIPDGMKLIPAELYDRLDYLGLIPDTNDVRSHNVGTSNYASHIVQPWSVWLDYPKLTSWDHDIIKRVLRTKSDNPRHMDYEKIIHDCQERLRQLEFFED